MTTAALTPETFLEIQPLAPRTFRLRSQTWVPRPLAEVFPFFADAFNLERITPPFMSFHVVTPAPIRMEPGRLIDYRLKVHGIPLRWQSRIERWEPPYLFTDIQIRGPYRRWEHTHTFSEAGEGTLIEDEVIYEVPVGQWVNRLFVQPDVERIFRYRQEVIASHFAPPA